MAMHAYRFHSIEADGPWTSEPFPAAERRHIIQGVIGGFLSGRPRWATDIDGTFIYGLDAKGKEMKAAPVHHATMKTVKTVTVTAKKKSPAQLQREIDEALAGKGAAASEGLTPAQRAYVVLFEQDVNNHPDAYKAEVRANPGKAAIRTIDGLDDEDVRQFTRDLRDEIKLVERTSRSRAGHATKKRASQPRVVGKHGLGTADVRTGEGAYWIVTVPTGYRVDYKPWGPSSEVDLGTFKARTKARAKITAHARSVGAAIVS